MKGSSKASSASISRPPSASQYMSMKPGIACHASIASTSALSPARSSAGWSAANAGNARASRISKVGGRRRRVIVIVLVASTGPLSCPRKAADSSSPPHVYATCSHRCRANKLEKMQKFGPAPIPALAPAGCKHYVLPPRGRLPQHGDCKERPRATGFDPVRGDAGAGSFGRRHENAQDPLAARDMAAAVTRRPVPRLRRPGRGRESGGDVHWLGAGHDAPLRGGGSVAGGLGGRERASPALRLLHQPV